nr:PREDICTED: ubiquitin-40S ribosomal protein S27a [Bemisia tabaci]XP_018912363.1 PREDICTED: ubiquitin-40S ribosomal protein S27a [Bemisia tabaci]
MYVFVHNLEGKSVPLEVQPNETVACLKHQIEASEALPVREQRLIFGGSQLEDDKTLADYSILKGNTIHLTLSLAGGAKKRKKKNYSTPKKLKHKRKKVKLAVLKFYKVDENGKISRLRRECDSESCGGGVFMAAMEDRHYCGKCHYTLVFNKPEEK